MLPVKNPGMSDEELARIESSWDDIDPYRNGSSHETLKFAFSEAKRDVPALVAEIKRLRGLLDVTVSAAILGADERVSEMIASGDWEGQYSMGFVSTVSQVILDGMP